MNVLFDIDRLYVDSILRCQGLSSVRIRYLNIMDNVKM